MIIGITGGVGSGKSTAMDYISANWPVRLIKTDELAKELMQESLLSQLEKAFGRSLRDRDGRLDSSLYRNILYEDKENTRISDSLVHPAVWKEAGLRARRASEEGLMALVETALPGKEFRELCDVIIAVCRDDEKRRSSLSRERSYDDRLFDEIRERQPEPSGYAAYGDIVIKNNGSINEFKDSIKKELDAICKSCEREQR